MSKRLAPDNKNDEIISEIVSPESLKEISKFKDLQMKLSKQLSQQREELCKSMTKKLVERGQIEKELSDLARSVSATRQRIRNAKREYSIAKSNLADAYKNLQDAEDAVSRKQRDVQEARETRYEATKWTLIAAATLIFAPFAIGAFPAIYECCSYKIKCEIFCRNAALEVRDSCVKRLKQAEAELKNAQSGLNRQYREKNMLEEKIHKTSETLNTIQDTLKEINNTFETLNLEVLCQERVKLNAQTLGKTIAYEARMRQYANIESIEVSYRELEEELMK